MKTILFKIISIEGVLFSSMVQEIILTTESGQISILPNHIPIISIVKEGTITIKSDLTHTLFKTSAGMIEVRPNNEAYLIVEEAKEI